MSSQLKNTRLDHYQIEIPEHLIATHPSVTRSASRLLAIEKDGERLVDSAFLDLPSHVNRGDLLVFNDTRVLPCRVPIFHVRKQKTVEALFIPSGSKSGTFDVLVKGVMPGDNLQIEDFVFTTGERNEDGSLQLPITISKDELDNLFERAGSMPLPPYILKKRTNKSWDQDRERYQTIFARREGSVAAPTAGLHFDDHVVTALQEKGVELASITLHVGRGTFQPIRCDDIRDHQMHSEFYCISQETRLALDSCKKRGGRVIAVGTTSLRALEAAQRTGQWQGWTDLYLYPGAAIESVDGLLTNFHLSGSSLLLLVMAFAGEATIRRAYHHAIQKQYRFFSYGDCSLIL